MKTCKHQCPKNQEGFKNKVKEQYYPCAYLIKRYAVKMDGSVDV
jgi:hypothetical protein